MIQKLSTRAGTFWDKWKTVLTNLGITLLGLSASQGVVALVLIIVARRVTPNEYAQYLSSYALASLLIILPNYGLEMWLLAEGSATSSKLASLWRGGMRARLYLLAIWLLGMLVLTAFLPAAVFPINILLPTSLGLACDSLSLVSYSALRSQGWHKRVTAFQLLGALALLTTTLALPPGSDYIILFCIGRATVSAGVAFLVIGLVGNWLRPSSTIVPIVDVLRTARAFLLSDLAVAIYLRADLIIVSLFLGPSGASVYGPALSLINMLFLIPNAFYLVMIPIVARVYAETGTFGRIGMMQLVLQMLTGIVISSGVFWFGQATINYVFGDAYAPSGAVLRLLSPIPFLKSLNFGLALLLTVGGLQGWRSIIQTFCATFNVVTNLLIVVPFGVVGVSVVYTLSEMLLLGGYGVGIGRWRCKRSRYV